MFRKSNFGFTLAEMMVVMLILSIIMAAMAPVMTTRNKLDQSSPWVWADNGSDAYYGLGDAQVAMIGQDKVSNTDTGARFIISAGYNKDHLLLKSNNNIVGRLRMVKEGILLGTTPTTPSRNSTGVGSDVTLSGFQSTAYGYKSTAAGDQSIAIGGEANASTESSIAIGTPAQAQGNNSIAIGTPAQAQGNNSISLGSNSFATGRNSISLGSNESDYTATQAQGNNSISIGSWVIANSDRAIAIGYQTQSTAQGGIAIGTTVKVQDSSGIAIGGSSLTTDYGGIAIGNNARSLGYTGIAIGTATQASKSYGISLGYNTQASGVVGLAISNNSKAQGDYSIAIGNYSLATGLGSIALGSSTTSSSTYNTYAQGESSIAIGDYSQAQGDYSISIGGGAKVQDNYSIALGSSAQALGANSIALGDGAKAAGTNNIAIGANACQYATGANQVCIGAGSGPGSFELEDRRNSTSEVIYLGTKNTTVYIPGNLIVGKWTVLGARSVDDGNPYQVFLRAGNKDYNSSWVLLGTDDYEGGDDNFYRIAKFGPLGPFGPFIQGSGIGSDSDRRLKYVGKESTSGLDKIKQLKVFNYTFKKDKKKTPHVGVIAQDLQKVFPDAVSKAKDGFLRIRFEDMFYAMINAIKELDTRILALEKENQQLKETIKQIQNDNKKQEARLKALEAKIK